MRYFASPGKLELEIAAFCERKKIRWALWPQMDRYDVEIQFWKASLAARLSARSSDIARLSSSVMIGFSIIYLRTLQ